MLLLMSLSVSEQPQEVVPCGYVPLEFNPMTVAEILRTWSTQEIEELLQHEEGKEGRETLKQQLKDELAIRTDRTMP